jgi:hypothetical protein
MVVFFTQTLAVITSKMVPLSSLQLSFLHLQKSQQKYVTNYQSLSHNGLVGSYLVGHLIRVIA